MAKAKQTGGAGTHQLPRSEWKTYFDRFTRRYLNDDQPETTTIELVSPTLGDQLEVAGARLLGVTYDPKDNLVELQLEEMEHLVFVPAEIWIIEGDDGFISTLEVVRADGTKEIVYIRKSDRLVPRYEPPTASPS